MWMQLPAQNPSLLSFPTQAETRCKADALTSIEQIAANLKASKVLVAIDQSSVEAKRREAFDAKIAGIERASGPQSDGRFGTGFLSKAHKAVTNTGFIHNNTRPTKPLSFINCGGGRLGWLGIKLASDAEAGGEGKGRFVISQRYKIPVLAIVLNNEFPNGLAAKATSEEINISFEPVPDYAGIAKAAGGGPIHAMKVEKAAELEVVLEEAVATVQAGTTMVLDCKIVCEPV
ncbi:unnamed protein product [Clonostachys byssicola]|uniref:Thiamine pyrophosphate enzyme TPP-binding domain-containing protein n=1 Tax=Clonostachys byssicola TaxID=160290 RepID=A0A9N9UMJ7_9HYPO|nr:unnamed protein product [Clonostachys byssicola]